MNKNQILAMMIQLIFATSGFTQKVEEPSRKHEPLKVRISNSHFTFLHVMITAEYSEIEKIYFTRLISDSTIPTAELLKNTTGFSTYAMWQHLFLGCSYTYNTSSEKLDHLKRESTLHQNNFAFKTGYNFYGNPKLVASIYGGIRMFKFRHFTYTTEKIDLPQYLNTGTIDLRVFQFSGLAGMNIVYLFKENISLGLYTDYMYNLSEDPIVKAKKNRIASNIPSPVNELLIGINFGFGFNEFLYPKHKIK